MNFSRQLDKKTAYCQNSRTTVPQRAQIPFKSGMLTYQKMYLNLGDYVKVDTKILLPILKSKQIVKQLNIIYTVKSIY